MYMSKFNNDPLINGLNKLHVGCKFAMFSSVGFSKCGCVHILLRHWLWEALDVEFARCCMLLNKVSSDDEMLNIKRQGYRTMSTEAISKLQINKYRQFLFLFFFRSSPKRGRYWKGRASVLSSIITMEWTSCKWIC